MKRLVICLIMLFGISFGMVALSADFDGDGTNDIGIFRESTGLWAIRGITRAYFGRTDDRPLPGDYDGDETIDISIFRPASGLWAIRDVTRTYFGRSGDEPLIGIGGGGGLWSQGTNGIFYNGNVGIGTTSPSTKLDVIGIIMANGGNSTNWNEAFRWGDHSIQNYLDLDIYPNTDIDSTDDFSGSYADLSNKPANIDEDSTDDLVDADFRSAGLMKTDGASGYSTTTDNSNDWNIAYSERRQWDGSETNLNPTTGRDSLKLGTMATQSANAVSITGGSISGNTISSGIVDSDFIEFSNYFINSAGTPGQAWKSDGDGRGHWASDSEGGEWCLWSQSGSDIYYDAGKVGIGTITPETVLWIKGTEPVLTIDDNQDKDWSVGDVLGSISFRTSDTSGRKAREVAGIKLLAGSGGVTVGGELAIYTSPNNQTAIEVMRIDESGNIGIGTMNPSTKLDVVGTAQMTGFKMPTGASIGYVLTSDVTGVGNWQAATGGDITAVNAGTGLTEGGDSGDVTLNVDFGGSGSANTVARSDHNHDATYVNEGQYNSVTTAMIIDGQIINADISATAAIDPSKISGTAWTSANDGAGSELDADLLDGQHASAFGDGHSLDAVDGSPINVVYVDNSGNVGIGTTSPGKKLDVDGDINADAYYGDGSNLTDVSATNIADNTITSEKIVDGEVKTVDIGEGQITEVKISQNTIDDSEIEDNSLSSSSLAANSVRDSEIDYSAVTLNDFNNDAGFITDDTNVQKNHLVNSGTLSFDWQNDEVADSLNISASGSVEDGALSANVTKLGQSIESGEITNGTIQTTDIADDQLTVAKLAHNIDATGINFKAKNSDQVDGHDAGTGANNLLVLNGSGLVPDSNIPSGITRDSELDHLDAADGSPTNAVYVDNSGNVGIGTTGPSQRLDVVGNAEINGNIIISGTVDGRDVSVDGTKLDGIETNAKDDQTITAGSGLTDGGIGDVALNVGAGSGISVSADAVAHADTSSQSSVNNSGGTIVQDITLDTYGHLTGLTSYDLDERYFTEIESDGRYLRKDANTTQNNGLYIATDQVRARDSGGLKLYDDGGSGIFVEDGGDVGIGTTNPSEKLEVNGTIKATSFQGDGSQLTGISGIPSGVIVMWSGQTIPDGWALCDGTGTPPTPNLKDRFVVSIGDEYSVHDTGGEKEHTLTIDEMPAHTHGYQRVCNNDTSGNEEGRTGRDLSSQQTTSVGGSQPHENRPPYYALAFIMKL